MSEEKTLGQVAREAFLNATGPTSADDWECAVSAAIAAETREADQLTAAEVIAELHGCLDTIKHLSAEIGADSGDIAVHGVALLGLAKIDHWKEANGGK